MDVWKKNLKYLVDDSLSIIGIVEFMQLIVNKIIYLIYVPVCFLNKF